MRLLLDSSGAELVCALADAQGVILEEHYPGGSLQARDLSTAVGSVLGELWPRDLKAIVVGCGPGSFIGTRVAICFANGLAAAGQMSVVPVSSLAAIGAVYGSGASVVLRDARRDEVYWAGMEHGGYGCRLIPIADLAQELALRLVSSVIVENSRAEPMGKAPYLDRIFAAAQSSNTKVTVCSGVPAEGLRRLGLGMSAVDYAEPVYLRGFH